MVLVILIVLELDIENLAAEPGLGPIDDRCERQNLTCCYSRTGAVLIIAHALTGREAYKQKENYQKERVECDHLPIVRPPT